MRAAVSRASDRLPLLAVAEWKGTGTVWETRALESLQAKETEYKVLTAKFAKVQAAEKAAEKAAEDALRKIDVAKKTLDTKTELREHAVKSAAEQNATFVACQAAADEAQRLTDEAEAALAAARQHQEEMTKQLDKAEVPS